MKTNVLTLSFSLVSAIALAACQGQIAPLGEIEKPIVPEQVDGGGGGGGGGSGGGGGGGGSAGGGVWEIPDCAEPQGDQNSYASIADTEAKIAGTWFLCSGRIHSPTDTTGIEITTGEAHFLVTSGTTIARGTTPDHARSVTILDTTMMNGPGAYQINLSTPSGYNTYVSRTSQDGRFLELNEGTSGNRGRYVRATRRAAASCDTPLGTAHAYTSIADVRDRIAGSWKVCSGGITSPTDAKGLELATPKAYYLVDSPTGLVRKPTWDYERDVAILDTTMMNGPGHYQINLSSGGGTNMYSSKVSEDGTRLELDEGTSGKRVSLVRVR